MRVLGLQSCKKAAWDVRAANTSGVLHYNCDYEKTAWTCSVLDFDVFVDVHYVLSLLVFLDHNTSQKAKANTVFFKSLACPRAKSKQPACPTLTKTFFVPQTIEAKSLELTVPVARSLEAKVPMALMTSPQLEAGSRSSWSSSPVRNTWRVSLTILTNWVKHGETKLRLRLSCRTLLFSSFL